jgi:hypothetical protein
LAPPARLHKAPWSTAPGVASTQALGSTITTSNYSKTVEARTAERIARYGIIIDPTKYTLSQLLDIESRLVVHRS